MTTDPTPLRRRLWGRSISHPLSQGQKDLLERGKDQWHFQNDGDSFLSAFPKKILEIGFGDGEHLIHQAKKHSNTGFIGCERFLNGVVKVLDAIEKDTITNIRLFSDDVTILLEHLPDHSLSTIYVLFPDPWPKKRHKKRRLLNSPFIAQLHKKLTPAGSLIMASDDTDYQEFIQEETAKLQELFTLKEITDPPRTKYCRKADREGRTSKMFVYEAT